MKRVLVCAVVLLSASTAAAECPVPVLPAAKTLTNWSISHGGATTSAKERHGVVRLGENPASEARTSFDCGSHGGHCNVTFPVAAPYDATGQSMTVRFRYKVSGAWKERAITFHRQPGATEHPVHLSLPTCGEIEVRVSGDAGSKPTMQSPFEAGPFYVECRDCKLKERGTKGT
jgi:hypothetical protein